MRPVKVCMEETVKTQYSIREGLNIIFLVYVKMTGLLGIPEVLLFVPVARKLFLRFSSGDGI